MHGEALAAVDWLHGHGHESVVLPQVPYEYWVVATRPKENNGLGLETSLAEQAITRWSTIFRLQLDERGIFRLWLELVTLHQVKGKLAHDARLVAAMQRHSLSNILTFNTADFVRFPGIQIYSPAEVLAGRIST